MQIIFEIFFCDYLYIIDIQLNENIRRVEKLALLQYLACAVLQVCQCG